MKRLSLCRMKYLIKAEICKNFKNIGEILSYCMTFLVMVFVYSYFLQDKIADLGTFAVIILISAVFTHLNNSRNFFENDYKNGLLEQYLLRYQNIYLTILVKIVTRWIFYGSAISLLSFASYYILTSSSLETSCKIFVTSLAMSLYMITVLSINSAISLGSRTLYGLTPLITIPISFPALICSVFYVNGENNLKEFNLLLVSVFVLLLIYTHITSHIIKFVIENE